jgi:hypothetical protein
MSAALSGIAFLFVRFNFRARSAGVSLASAPGAKSFKGLSGRIGERPPAPADMFCFAMELPYLLGR